MAKGMGEPPQESLSAHLMGLEYPVTREEIVETASSNDAPTDLINFLKCLPLAAYDSLTTLQRDFAEAARRFGLGPDKPAWFDGEHDRSNLGRDAVEHAPPGHTRHP